MSLLLVRVSRAAQGVVHAAEDALKLHWTEGWNKDDLGAPALDILKVLRDGIQKDKELNEEEKTKLTVEITEAMQSARSPSLSPVVSLFAEDQSTFLTCCQGDVHVHARDEPSPK